MIETSPFGFLIIDKPAGLTSHDCVNRLRKVFNIKRVGHGGTLDPEVTGVLPIAIGNATRLLPYLPGEKAYVGIIQLGLTTTTDDLSGEKITQAIWPKLETKFIQDYLYSFQGSIQQRPPKISSVNLKGERAYKRARRGEIFELPLKEITIHEIELLSWDNKVGQIKISVICSSGTYIRSLARDLGEKIGCGGCLAKLRRTQALGFKEEQAVKLPERNIDKDSPRPLLLDPLSTLKHLTSIHLTSEEEKLRWQSGNKIIASKINYPPKGNVYPKNNSHDVVVVIEPDGKIAGIGNFISPLIIQPKVVFNAKG